MTPTVGAFIEFILKNKSDRCFYGYTEAQIWAKVKDAIDNGTIFYSANRQGKIDGIILAEKREDNTVLFVTECLAMSISTLKKFAKNAKFVFTGMRLEAYRRDKHVKYNTDKLYKKLT